MSHLQTSTGIVVSQGNSTSTPLGSNATFTGAAENVSSYEELDVNIAGSPSNAPGSLYFEFSPDGTNWDVSVQVSGAQLPGPSIAPLFLRVVLPWFRVRYVNGSTVQTAFRLTTAYHRTSAVRLTRFLNQTLDDTESIENVRAVIAHKHPDGSYVNVTHDDPLPVINLEVIALSGSAAPASGTLVAGKNYSAGTLVPLRMDVSGSLFTHDANRFKTLLKFEAVIGEELRADDVVGGDLYHGRAPDGTATSTAPWEIVRFYRDSLTGNVTRTRYRLSGSWDSRSSGWT